MQRNHLLTHLNALLTPHKFNDYCPNGLQIQGTDEINTIILGVTASQALIDHAIAQNADAVIVHHGYFWKGEDPCITGIRQQRIKKLLQHNINLIAYHLPLDAHPRLGNNAQLAQLLGIDKAQSIQPDVITEIIWQGEVDCSAQDFAQHLHNKLGKTPLHIGGDTAVNTGDFPTHLRNIAWCSGGAQSYFERAIEHAQDKGQKIDAFFSGEASEATFHIAQEHGIHYFAAGHHATEKGGVIALGKHIQAELGINTQFIDCINPI